eukprot:PhM_4_TR286/c0_g10_i1/m.80540
MGVLLVVDVVFKRGENELEEIAVVAETSDKVVQHRVERVPGGDARGTRNWFRRVVAKVLLLLLVLFVFIRVFPTSVRARCLLRDGPLALKETLKLRHVLNVRDEHSRLADAAQTPRAHHSHVPQDVADLRDKLAELVEVRLAVLEQPQLPDVHTELLCARKREAVVGAPAHLLEVAGVLDEPGLDVVVEQELTDERQLAREELVHKVNRCVHDAGAVRADGVGDVPDLKGVHEPRVCAGGTLDEHLAVHVVCVTRDKVADASCDDEDIEALVHNVTGQVGLRHVDVKDLLRERTHFFVGLPILRVQSREVVELLLQVVLDNVADAHNLIEETYVADAQEAGEVLRLGLDHVVCLAEDDAVDMETKEVLHLAAQRLDQRVVEQLRHLRFVGLDKGLVSRTVACTVKQRNGVTCSHANVGQLGCLDGV